MTDNKLKKKIFLDLDGVMVDWVGGVAGYLGLQLDDPGLRARFRAGDGHQVMDELVVCWETLGRNIEEDGPNFWSGLRLFPWATLLVNSLRGRFGSEASLQFLTSPGSFLNAYHGKRIWQHRFFPDVELIVCRNKYVCAHPNALLIDDTAKQLVAFADHGGHTHLWPNQFTLEDESINGDEAEARQLEAVKAAVAAVRQKLLTQQP